MVAPPKSCDGGPVRKGRTVSSNFSVSPTEIPGLLLIDVPVYGDNRGWFKENWQNAKLAAAGLPVLGPVQNNISFNAAVGVTRGIHAEPWDKYISVANGKVFGAWVDLRPGSGFGRVVTAEIGPDRAVFVPRGVGNAFQTLQPGTSYTYLVNAHWSADAQDDYTFVNLADPELAVPWPIPLAEAEVSDKDRHHPMLTDVEPVSEPPVLILGSSGQLGRALVKTCEEQGQAFTTLDRPGFDLSNIDADHLGSLRRFKAVINAAAFTDVDGAESPEGSQQAWAINATGVADLARHCEAAGVPLLHVSTDYVFDGSRPLGQSYSPQDPIVPLNVYGASKAAGELAVTTTARHWVVRTSWLIGDGPNFVRTMLGLADRGIDPKVVDDQWGRLTFTTDLANAILHLIRSSAPYGTYHVTGSGEAASWFAIARHVFELAGADPHRVSPVTAEEYYRDKPLAARRPTNSVMDLAALRDAGFDPPDHFESLEKYIRDEKERAES